MSQTIVVFHSALGLRPAIHRFADVLRARNHIVYTPDSFDGEVFNDLKDGVQKRDSLGIPELIKRAKASVSSLPDGIVYAGFSMGAAAAQLLAATRPGARGAILMHAALPIEMIGVDRWPSVPVQLHFATRDPWVDSQGVERLSSAIRSVGQRCEVYSYESEKHLFDDDESGDFDASASILMRGRILEFLESL